MSEIVLAVVGSRDCKDKARVFQEIDGWCAANGTPGRIVSGGANGVDTLAEAYAREHSIALTVFAADWKQHGKAAGPIRNSLIVAECTHVLALPSPSSTGTLDTIRKAQHAAKPCTIVTLT